MRHGLLPCVCRRERDLSLSHRGLQNSCPVMIVNKHVRDLFGLSKLNAVNVFETATEL